MRQQERWLELQDTYDRMGDELEKIVTNDIRLIEIDVY